MEIVVPAKYTVKDLKVDVGLDSQQTPAVQVDGTTFSLPELFFLKLQIETGATVRGASRKLGLTYGQAKELIRRMTKRNSAQNSNPDSDQDSTSSHPTIQLIICAENARLFDLESLLAVRMMGLYLQGQLRGSGQSLA